MFTITRAETAIRTALAEGHGLIAATRYVMADARDEIEVAGLPSMDADLAEAHQNILEAGRKVRLALAS